MEALPKNSLDGFRGRFVYGIERLSIILCDEPHLLAFVGNNLCDACKSLLILKVVVSRREAKVLPPPAPATPDDEVRDNHVDWIPTIFVRQEAHLRRAQC